MISRTGHLQKAAPVDGVCISDETYRALAEQSSGFRAGATLDRHGLETWVVQR